MPKSNFLFFLNSYNDLSQTSAPALNQFKWSREINGVPYNLSNSQEIQVLPSATTPNVIPYPFSNLAATINTVSVNSTVQTITNSLDGVAVGEQVIGMGVTPETRITAFTNTTIFSVTSANATAGATYTNNGQTFTVLNTISGAATLVTTGTGAPFDTDTLTKTSGTGDATIPYSSFVGPTITLSKPITPGNYTFTLYNPASFLYIESDQQISVIYNEGDAIAINPFEINGITLPGVFFINGPVYSLEITNLSAVTANVFFASMG